MDIRDLTCQNWTLAFLWKTQAPFPVFSSYSDRNSRVTLDITLSTIHALFISHQTQLYTQSAAHIHPLLWSPAPARVTPEMSLLKCIGQSMGIFCLSLSSGSLLYLEHLKIVTRPTRPCVTCLLLTFPNLSPTMSLFLHSTRTTHLLRHTKSLPPPALCTCFSVRNDVPHSSPNSHSCFRLQSKGHLFRTPSSTPGRLPRGPASAPCLTTCLEHHVFHKR